MMLKFLRFKEAKIKLSEAAILLAINQSPWADKVFCSMEDYMMAGYQSNYAVIRIMKNEYPYYHEEESNFHDVMIFPINKIYPGTVYLGE